LGNAVDGVEPAIVVDALEERPSHPVEMADALNDAGPNRGLVGSASTTSAWRLSLSDEKMPDRASSPGTAQRNTLQQPMLTPVAFLRLAALRSHATVRDLAKAMRRELGVFGTATNWSKNDPGSRVFRLD
jgi:hypothetical protein